MLGSTTSYPQSPTTQKPIQTSTYSSPRTSQWNAPLRLGDLLDLDKLADDEVILLGSKSQGSLTTPGSPTTLQGQDGSSSPSAQSLQSELASNDTEILQLPESRLAISDKDLHSLTRWPGISAKSYPYYSINTHLYRQMEYETAQWEADNPFNLSASNYMKKGLLGEPVRHIQKPQTGNTILIEGRDNQCWHLKTTPNNKGPHKNEYTLSCLNTKKSTFLTVEEYHLLQRCLRQEVVKYDVDPFKRTPDPPEIKIGDSLVEKLKALNDRRLSAKSKKRKDVSERVKGKTPKPDTLVYKSEAQYHVSFFAPFV